MLVEVNDKGFSPAVLKVIGLGGAGGNAVNRMLESEIRGVEFLVANTDVQALNASTCPNGIQIGAEITGGLGSGGDPSMGRQAAEDDRELIRERLHGADMVFITAGMGGGTGTGASAVVAEVARDLGALTVAIVTKPFTFEGRRRMRQAEAGLEELREFVDTLIVIPNQRLLHVVDRSTPLNEALRVADDVLSHATKGISEIITVPGLVNVDFADVRSVMTGMGNALMGMGFAQGSDRAREASQMAIASPLLEDISISGARGVLVNFMGGPDMTLAEVDEASNQILEAAGDDANVIFGAVIDQRMKDEIRVTLIATGFGLPTEQGAPRVETEAERVFREELRGSAPPLMPKGEPLPQPVGAFVSTSSSSSDPQQRGRLSERDPQLGSPALNREPLPMPGSASLPAKPDVQVQPMSGGAQTQTAANSAMQPMRAPSRAQVAENTVVDGVVGPARPIRRIHEVPVQEPGRHTASSPGRGQVSENQPPVNAPENVVPLVWKQNLGSQQWSPTMTSRWQRVLRRDRLEVPSFLRRRQVD